MQSLSMKQKINFINFKSRAMLILAERQKKKKKKKRERTNNMATSQYDKITSKGIFCSAISSSTGRHFPKRSVTPS